MLKQFFNHASMHPVKTALYGGALILAAPFIAPYASVLFGSAAVAPAASIGHLLGLTGVVVGGGNMVANVAGNIGPTFNAASQNGGKIALTGLGLGVGAPYAAPLLGSLGAPALAFAAAVAPLAIVIGGGLLAAKLISPLIHKAPPAPAQQPQHP